MIEIRIPFDAYRTSPNRKEGATHHVRAVNLKKQQAALEDVARWCWAQAGCPRLEGKVVVETVVERARRLDDDNLAAALKKGRDALFAGRKYPATDGHRRASHHGAITPDDGVKYCRFLPIQQVTGQAFRFREAIIYRVYTEKEYAEEEERRADDGR